MSPITAHVHQLYIAATPEQVWQAITDSEWTKRFFFGTVFVRPPEAGQPYRTVGPDGKDTTEGTIEELVAAVRGRPGPVRADLADLVRLSPRRRATQPGGVDGRIRR